MSGGAVALQCTFWRPLASTLSQAAMRRMRPLGVRGAGTPAKWIGWAAAMAKERACSSVTPRVRPAAPAVGEMIFHTLSLQTM